jgi:hypothetical protein
MLVMKIQIVIVVVSFGIGSVFGGWAVCGYKQNAINAIKEKVKAAPSTGKQSLMDQLQFSDKPVHW